MRAPASLGPRRPRHSPTTLVLALALVLAGMLPWLAGCGGADSSNTVRQLVILSGDNQAADADTDLPQPLHVQALGAGATPLAGATIRFSVLKGHGRMDPSFVRTDSNGEARVTYTLGILPVENEIEAAAGNQSVVFHAQALNLSPPDAVEMVSGFLLPEGIVFDNRGGLYLGTQLLGQLYRITPDWRYTLVAAGLGQVLGVAVGPREEVYACDASRNLVHKVDPATGSAEDFAKWFDFAGFAQPNGIAVHPSGDVYFSEGAGSRVLRVTPGGHVSEFLGGLSRPNGIAFGPGGRTLYVNELGANRVIVSEVLGGGQAGEVTTVAENVETPDGIALDTDGNVYVVSTQLQTLRNRIVLITPEGEVTELFQAPFPKVYANIGFGRAGFDVGTLYMVSFNGTVDAVYVGVDGLVVGGPALVD